MQIILNGKPYALEKSVTIAELSEILKLEKTQVAIERNREIVPRSNYAEVILNENDQVEIVTFIGGG